MFTQPAPSPPTLATTTSPVSPASPQRPSRLRGLSYLRNYTHNHLHARDNNPNNEAPSATSPRRYTLTRATSYPSPTSTQANNRQSGTISPALLSPVQRLADNESAGNQGAEESPSGWLSPVAGQSGVQQTQTQPKTDPNTIGLAVAMGRTRSATTGRAPGPDVSQMNGSAEPQPQSSVAPAHPPPSGVNGTDSNVYQLPSIRFSQHQEIRAPRPSLVFSPMSRTLPTGKETIRVGRYSERENQPNPASYVPSAAPIGFKSKVVSRRHCEFWFEEGQWYIKDVKSSSGTFLNHVRLSSPGTESKPFPVKDGDIVQLGIDFKGGEEMIFRCVKIRIELNRGWQNSLNSFNVASHKRLRNMAKQNLSPSNASSSQDCTICLGPVAPCQSLFVAPCSHTWHYKCVRRIINGPMWPQFICPNCRAVADLEADVDDPFPDAEWEEVDVDDAAGVAEEQAGPTQPISVSEALQVPSAERTRSISRAGSINDNGSSQEHNGEDTTGSESDLQQAVHHLNITPQGSNAADSTDLHDSTAPVDIRSGRSASRQETSSDGRTETSGVDSFMRSDRTPSPSGRLPTGAGDIMLGPDGPMTPRNDVGPFVFDGSAGRATGAQMSTLNLTGDADMPPADS